MLRASTQNKMGRIVGIVAASKLGQYSIGHAFVITEVPAETHAFIHANRASVRMLHVETDGLDAGFAQSHRDRRRNDLRQALSPAIRPREDVADPGHPFVAGHHVYAGYRHQVATFTNPIKKAGVELKGSEGASADVARSIQPLDLLQITGAHHLRRSWRNL